ncbi:MAG: hypothetical protein ACJ75B_16130 [Flavisolibacter sp.]
MKSVIKPLRFFAYPLRPLRFINPKNNCFQENLNANPKTFLFIKDDLIRAIQQSA